MPAQTLREAKASYKKNGPRLSPRQVRALERGAELERRAQAIREKEKRRKAAEKNRVEREKLEKERRKILGIGLATQTCGWSLSQKNMKRGMEAFVGLKREVNNDMRIQHAPAGEDGSREPEQLKDPWDDEDVDEESLLDIAEPEQERSEQPKAKTTIAMNAPSAAVSTETPAPKENKDVAAQPSMGPPPLKRDHQGNVTPAYRWPTVDGIATQGGSERTGSTRLLNSREVKPSSRPVAGSKGNSSFINASVFRTIPQLDEWDDFLDSSTQIARDIHSVDKVADHAGLDDAHDFFISTQDLELSLDDPNDIVVKNSVPAEHAEDASRKPAHHDAPAPCTRWVKKGETWKKKEQVKKAALERKIAQAEARRLRSSQDRWIRNSDKTWKKQEPARLPRPESTHADDRVRQVDARPEWVRISQGKWGMSTELPVATTDDRQLMPPPRVVPAPLHPSIRDFGLSTQDVSAFDDDLQLSP